MLTSNICLAKTLKNSKISHFYYISRCLYNNKISALDDSILEHYLQKLGLKPNNKLIILYDQPNDFEFFIQKNKEKYNFMKYLENNSMKYLQNNDQQLINKIFEFKNKSIKLYLIV